MTQYSAKKKVTLSGKHRPACGVTVSLCVMAAMPMVFGSTLTLPTFVFFFSCFFFRLYLGVTLRG